MTHLESLSFLSYFSEFYWWYFYPLGSSCTLCLLWWGCWCTLSRTDQVRATGQCDSPVANILGSTDHSWTCSFLPYCSPTSSFLFLALTPFSRRQNIENTTAILEQSLPYITANFFLPTWKMGQSQMKGKRREGDDKEGNPSPSFLFLILSSSNSFISSSNFPLSSFLSFWLPILIP